MKKSITFWIEFCRILATKLAPFWFNFGSKNRSKIKIEFWDDFEDFVVRVRGPGRGSGRALKITELVYTGTYRCIKVYLTRPAVLRRIEHAARNTAAAPFCRRSSLEWPCKIWILLLSIGRLCCIFGVCWGVLVTILGALGAHFGSQNRSFWVPGGPLALRKNQSRKRPQKWLDWRP